MQKSITKNIRYIQDLIDLAKGPAYLAASLNVHQITVERWRRSGIPVKYWDDIFELYNVPPAVLHSVNKICRKTHAVK